MRDMWPQSIASALYPCALLYKQLAACVSCMIQEITLAGLPRYATRTVQPAQVHHICGHSQDGYECTDHSYGVGFPHTGWYQTLTYTSCEVLTKPRAPNMLLGQF